MTSREHQLPLVRPNTKTTTIHNNMSSDERFQNQTLRPIIKLQNNLLIAVFKNYIAKHKFVYYDLSLEKKMDYIENAIHKNTKFRNAIKGMIIGHFTLEEYTLYTKNSSALNKRMMHIVKQKLLDQIQLFEENSTLANA